MDRYYKILGLSSNATKEQIKEAYYTKIKALHPDKFYGTSLEDTANFFTTEINNAYETLMSQPNANVRKSNTNQAGCIEEDIFIEGMGQLRYSLSNDFNTILDALRKRSGVYKIDTSDLSWTLNTVLSENVKKVMNKYDVEYSMTIYKEGPYLHSIINRRSGGQWYYISFGLEINGVFYGEGTSRDYMPPKKQVYEKSNGGAGLFVIILVILGIVLLGIGLSQNQNASYQNQTTQTYQETTVWGTLIKPSNQSSVINLRKGPSDKHDILKRLSRGDRVQIVSQYEENGYIKVKTTGGTEGYVWSKFVGIDR